MTFLLSGFGLQIRSELAIPGARPCPAPLVQSACDLDIAYGTVPLAGDIVSSGPYRLSPEWLVFRTPGIASYSCRRDGRAMLIDPETVVLEDIQAMLIATALPACLWLRGGFVLHAGAARLPGTGCAIALAGPSGAGKSRLLQQALSLGGIVVAEDAISLHMDDDRITGSGLPGTLFLHDASAAHAASEQEASRTLFPVPLAQQDDTAPIAALLVLTPRDPVPRDPLPHSPVSRNPAPRSGAPSRHPALTRLHGSGALAALLNAVHRPRIPALLQQSADVFQTSARLANRLPLYLLNSPEDQQSFLDELPELMAAADQANEGKPAGLS